MSASELASSTDASALSARSSRAEEALAAPEVALGRGEVPLGAPGSVQVLPAGFRSLIRRLAARLGHDFHGVPASEPLLGFVRGRAACRRFASMHVHAGVT